MRTNPYNLPGLDGRLLWFVVYFTFFTTLAQSVDDLVDGLTSELNTIQVLEDGQLKLSWVNEGAIGYKVYRRDHLIEGEWSLIAALDAIEGPIQSFEVAMDTHLSTGFFYVEVIPDVFSKFKTLDLGNGVLLEMIHIPKGTFTMGSPEEEIDHNNSDEGPVTEVALTQDYMLGKYEITQAQWTAIMSHNPSQRIGDDVPVDGLSLTHAINFCWLLTEHMRSVEDLPEGYYFTLPTEAQWEYACRAGTQTRYSFGDDSKGALIDDYAWHRLNSGRRIYPIGEKLPNPWGFYDMHGNVMEYCQNLKKSRHTAMLIGNVIDPRGPNYGELGVLRGGSGADFPNRCRSASRWGGVFGNAGMVLFNGLRVALIKVTSE